MTWIAELERDGLRFSLMSDYLFEEIKGLKFMLHLEHSETQRAIAERDPRILEALEWAAQNARAISIAKWGEDEEAWQAWEWSMSIEELEERCNLVLSDNEFADDKAREFARIYLERCATRRYQAALREVKKKATKERRRQFQSNRDRLALALIERDGYRCSECGAHQDLTIDHIIPLSRGGDDSLDNLRWLCRSHNSQKGDRL